MAKQEPMTLIEFQQKFNSEKDCHDHLFKMKWPNGFECPKCRYNSSYVIKTRRHPVYECRSCKHQTTVTTGTIFEKLELPCLNGF